MFSFIKFAHKVLNTVLNKNPSLILEEFYQHTDLNDVHWVSLAVNKNSINGSLLTKELEILTTKDAFSLKIADSKAGALHQFWKNQQLQCKYQASSLSQFPGKFNLFIDQLINKKIINFQKALDQNLVSQNFTPTEISQDEKALEWIRVSFKILENAIIESVTNPELLFQALLFMGKNPKSQMHEIRLIIFNLDIKFVIIQNSSLRIQIYDDKNAQFGTSKKAALEGDFNFRKREILDELTGLISAASPGIKIHHHI